MDNPTDIIGEDVISLPGQNLTYIERQVLMGLADGSNPETIMRKTALDKTNLRHTERSIKNKLGAKTHTHIIARAFILNVLIPRCICAFLAFLSTGMVNDNQIRVRVSGRNSSSMARVAKSSKTSNYA